MPGKVLVVEDNLQNMRLVRKILTAAGYTVLEALDGLTGIAVATREQPHLILMDINLPDINGLEATTRLKAMPNAAWIPVVALTANAMHGDRENCLAAGCNGYLAKPVLKAELLAAVETYIHKSPKTTTQTQTMRAITGEDAAPSNGNGNKETMPPQNQPPILLGGAFPSSGIINSN